MQNEITKICDQICELAIQNTELSTTTSKIHSISMYIMAELMKRMSCWNEIEKDKTIVGHVCEKEIK